MANRKAELNKRIDFEILNTLKSSKNPMSTHDLAVKIGRAWHSVQTHCLKLQLRKKVKGFNLSNINFWIIKK